jgi:hypothetical protein
MVVAKPHTSQWLKVSIAGSDAHRPWARAWSLCMAKNVEYVALVKVSHDDSVTWTLGSRSHLARFNQWGKAIARCNRETRTPPEGNREPS